MSVLEVINVTHKFGRTTALHDVSFSVPERAMYAMLGPNGAGKTTIMKVITGLLKPTSGSVRIFGKPLSQLTLADRARIGYVAEGQPLPDWMTLDQLEAYLSPLYTTWDHALSQSLRESFNLRRNVKIKSLSRGDRMKVGLLVALAPRPKLLIMDEPFTGIDVVVKDDIVRGLVGSLGEEGWTVLISSHDIAELEMLCDWVGFLRDGHMRISEQMETLRERFRHVEITLDSARGALAAELPQAAVSVERSGGLLSFLVPVSESVDEYSLRSMFRNAMAVEIRAATLREVFFAYARAIPETTQMGVGVP